MAPSLKAVAVFFTGFLALCGAQVELDDRFLEKRGNDMWLVEFYAPWCGHCKRLEPVFREVALELRGTPVNVGKIDATRYSDVSAHFQIRGFPTIKFIKGDQVFTHRGDRTKGSILEFANKAQGPAVRKISSIGRFHEARSRHSDGVFFVYIGDDDEHEDLFTKYQTMAEKMMIQGYFYHGKKHILDEITPKNHPTVLVFKDGTHYEYLPEDGIVTMDSLQHWISSERYNAFPEVQGGGISEMLDVKKYLVMVVINPEIRNRMDANVKLREIAENVALNQRERYHKDFQFLWMADPETVNSITLSFNGPPLLVALDSDSQMYYLPEIEPADMTIQDFTAFLEDVKDGKLTGYGGTGFFQRLKRMGYDFLTTIIGIWQTSRWLFLLMFGLPTLIISVICYSLCCMESVDEPGEDELEEQVREMMEKVEDHGDEKEEKEKEEAASASEKSEGEEDEEGAEEETEPKDEEAEPKGPEEKKKD